MEREKDCQGEDEKESSDEKNGLIRSVRHISLVL